LTIGSLHHRTDMNDNTVDGTSFTYN